MSLGIWEILLLLVIVLVIFGAGKLPAVMGDLAKGIRTFKREMGGGEPAVEPAPPTPAPASRIESAPAAVTPAGTPVTGTPASPQG